jgi:hypothetical protein
VKVHSNHTPPTACKHNGYLQGGISAFCPTSSSRENRLGTSIVTAHQYQGISESVASSSITTDTSTRHVHMTSSQDEPEVTTQNVNESRTKYQAKTGPSDGVPSHEFTLSSTENQNEGTSQHTEMKERTEPLSPSRRPSEIRLLESSSPALLECQSLSNRHCLTSEIKRRFFGNSSMFVQRSPFIRKSFDASCQADFEEIQEEPSQVAESADSSSYKEPSPVTSSEESVSTVADNNASIKRQKFASLRSGHSCYDNVNDQTEDAHTVNAGTKNKDNIKVNAEMKGSGINNSNSEFTPQSSGVISSHNSSSGQLSSITLDEEDVDDDCEGNEEKVVHKEMIFEEQVELQQPVIYLPRLLTNTGL